MNKEKVQIHDKYNIESSSVNDLDGCATTEATGLIPALPESHAELTAYKEVLPYSPDCYVEKNSEKERTKEKTF